MSPSTRNREAARTYRCPGGNVWGRPSEPSLPNAGTPADPTHPEHVVVLSPAARAHGILTYDGRDVGPHEGTPSLRDLAIGLFRMPRFGGQGRRWWSVLDHSMFMAELARRDAEARGLDEPQTRAFRLAALLHDAHEAITADVPTPYKSGLLYVRQRSLDERIMAAYFPGGIVAYDAFAPDVKRLDRRALRAEAVAHGPPSLFNYAAVRDAFGEAPEWGDVDALKHSVSPSNPVGLNDPAHAPEVRRFLDLYTALR